MSDEAPRASTHIAGANGSAVQPSKRVTDITLIRQFRARPDPARFAVDAIAALLPFVSILRFQTTESPPFRSGSQGAESA